jgi:hypothetical protein
VCCLRLGGRRLRGRRVAEDSNLQRFCFRWRVFGRIFEMKMEEVIEEWKTLLNEMLNNLYSFLNIATGKVKYNGMD